MIGVIAVLPVDRIGSMVRRGWTLGRTNGFTGTVIQSFQTDGEARDAVKRLPRVAVWNIEISKES